VLESITDGFSSALLCLVFRAMMSPVCHETTA
jgi:hypothetical protein